MNNLKHMSELSLPKRLLAYLAILVGYFFYCYNFVVIDYVRPFLVEYYGITLGQTALFYTAQSIGGLPPIIAAILMIFVVPSDRKYIPFGNEKTAEVVETAEEVKKDSWSEMFSGNLRRITLTCVLLSGLNFVGYQFFSGFVTVYLREVRGFDASTMGILFSAASSGSLIGAWSWGIISDKFGRKVNAFGFILSAIMICLYFIAPNSVAILSVCGFVYGLGLSSSAIWGGYFTELFPKHLKSMGASLFNGGRIIAFFAPTFVVLVRNATSLQTAMWGAPIIFGFAGVLWLTLPETLEKGLFFKKK